MTQEIIRVLIADDHTVVRKGLMALLSAGLMAFSRANSTRYPQALHLSARTLGGTLLRSILYLFPQPLHLKLMRAFSDAGGSSSAAAGFSGAKAGGSLINE